jgi:hypothetical protein
MLELPSHEEAEQLLKKAQKMFKKAKMYKEELGLCSLNLASALTFSPHWEQAFPEIRYAGQLLKRNDLWKQ